MVPVSLSFYLVKRRVFRLVREPEMQEWLTQQDQDVKKRMALTQEIVEAVDRFYFNHYCNAFRSGAFARANSSMCVFPPMCTVTSNTAAML